MAKEAGQLTQSWPSIYLSRVRGLNPNPWNREDFRREVALELESDWQKEFHPAEKQCLKGKQRQKDYESKGSKVGTLNQHHNVAGALGQQWGEKLGGGQTRTTLKPG